MIKLITFCIIICMSTCIKAFLHIQPAKKNRLHSDKAYLQRPSSACFEVKVFNYTKSYQSFQGLFLNSQCWGRHPLLIRGAFKADADYLLQLHTDSVHTEQEQQEKKTWPTWEEIKTLASNEDAESRWITHTPNDDSSWTLDLGPFDSVDVDDALSSTHRTKSTFEDTLDVDETIRSTLIVNDVDRFVPSLFNWIHDNFSFIPHWRRDDGQVSLAHEGGGIGPHVDEYDVFLIQMAGVRRWELGNRFITVVEELEGDLLIKNLDVRIIRNWDAEKGEAMVLYPGDVLYLPPRIAHCGTALSNGCMTLSVGLRAPSARELINQIAEYSSSCFSSHELARRYDDTSLLEKYRVNGENDDMNTARILASVEISDETRNRMKRLIRDSLEHILENEFDELLGKFLTEPKRLRVNFPTPLDLDEETLDSQLNMVLNLGKGRLYPCNSICFAFSTIKINRSLVCQLFVDGNKWEIESNGIDEQEREVSLLKAIAFGNQLSRETFIDLEKAPDGSIPKRIVHILKDLLVKGYLKIGN